MKFFTHTNREQIKEKSTWRLSLQGFGGLASKGRRGFTLPELVVYCAILTLLVIVVMMGVAGVMKTYGTVRANQEISRSASTALERIVRDIRSAESIDVINSTLGVSPGVLILTIPVTEVTDKTVRFYLDNGRVYVEEDDVVIGALTTERAIVSVLSFTQITTAESQGVRINMTIDTSNGKGTITDTFTTTSVLRGSYGI
ncbi:MAG: prepilin-type N-terminal cleavage/methylation domain-containing protein [Patescibacteria group bacterium]